MKSYKGATYTWDRLNRLKSCVKSNGTAEYTYNAEGQPEKTELDYGNGMVGTTEREYVNGRLYKESKILTMNGAEIVSATMQYLYRGEEVIGLIYNGSLYYYRKNLQGDIIEIVDEDGNEAGRYTYDAWGNCSVSGSGVMSANPFRYRGYYWDGEAGLYYLNTRWYDPETGRFISPDSVNYLDPETLNGLNLYAYCLNNPVMYSDPYGTTAWWEWLIAGVLTAALIVGTVALSIATAGSTLIFVNLGVAALTGAAMGAGLSLATQATTGELDWGQFGIDIGVGAITGVITGGIGKIASSFGGAFGNALDYMRIGGLQVGSVFGFGNLSTVIGKTVETATGFASGVFLDKHVNQLFGEQDNIAERIKNNFDSTLISTILDIVKYIW